MYSSQNLDLSQSSRASGSLRDPGEKFNGLPANEHFQFPPQRQSTHQHALNSGPISAPAVAYHSEDYFSWSLHSNDLVHHDNEQEQGVAHHSRHHVPPQKAHAARRYSSNKIRHRSNLSHTYTDEPSPPVPDSLFARSDHAYDLELDLPGTPNKTGTIGNQCKPKPKTGKKPGFFLKLDDLTPAHSPLHKVQHQHRAFLGPLSDPNHGSAYDKIEFFESEGYQQSGAGDIGQAHNITPLMFPPNSEDLGYFGQFDQAESSSLRESDPIPGGYLNVTSKIHDPLGHSGTSGNNSDIDSYLNFQVDDYTATQNFDKNQYHTDIRDYTEEMENTKVEAHFTPISGYQDHDFQQGFDERHLLHHNSAPHYGHELHIPPIHEHTVQRFSNDEHSGHEYGHQYDFHHPDYHQGPTHTLGQNFDHGKHTHAHYANSYGTSEHGHQIESKENLLHNGALTRQSADGGETFDHPPIEDYPYEDSQSYKDANTSNALEDGDSPSDSQMAGQQVESSDTDQLGSAEKKVAAKKRKGVKGIVCSVCGKLIVRDFSRHLRIHDEAGRFQCIFPPGYCKHKSRKFNRPYDYKKHLLNVHFKFDESSAKLLPNLTEKLNVRGQCNACGQRFVANEWLEGHILTSDRTMKCYELQRIEDLHKSDQEGKDF